MEELCEQFEILLKNDPNREMVLEQIEYTPEETRALKKLVAPPPHI
jgi:hypothetical protein